MSILYSNDFFKNDKVKIPLFNSGKPVHSKYNPQKEAENFINTIEDADFFVVFGLGAGFHIEALKNKFPSAKILAADFYEEDVNFLKENFQILSSLEKSVIFSTFKNFSTDLKKNYIPAKYKKLSALFLPSWKNANETEFENFKKLFDSVLKEISLDFSTQSHFGKIWQKNIIKNIFLKKKQEEIFIDTRKTACIIAAGPSLDETVKSLQNENENFIIATDTSYKILLKYNIFCDAVVSVDGQFVSKEHFTKKIDKKTLFILDYASNPLITEKIIKNKNKNIFFSSGHPLTLYAEKTSSTNNILKLDSGSGTVTICALDFAIKAGFSKIKIFASDFSFKNNKPYAKGSYLDDIFMQNQTKFSPLEKQFTSLMYRTKTELNEENIKTTEILNQYKSSFFSVIKNSDYETKTEKNIITLQSKTKKNSQIFFSSINFSIFSKILKENTENLIRNPELFFNSDFETALLPYISFLRTKKENKNVSYKELLVKAAKSLERLIESL